MVSLRSVIFIIIAIVLTSSGFWMSSRLQAVPKKDFQPEQYEFYNQCVGFKKIAKQKKKTLEAIVNKNGYRKDFKPANCAVMTQDLSNKTVLDLGGQQISDLSALKGFHQFEKLFLWDNQIQDIRFLEDMVHLKELYLWENKIEDLSPLKSLKELTKLYLYNNRIKDVSPLKDLTQLKEIYLIGNQISETGALSTLTQLQRLEMRGNPITDKNKKQLISSLSHATIIW